MAQMDKIDQWDLANAGSHAFTKEMTMIKFKQKGDFNKTTAFMEKVLNLFNKSTFDKYGEEGVKALQEATPKNSGLTASSWSYKIVKREGRVSIEFHNACANDGVPIAIILQYGHSTGTGGWVEGIDYINPALRPVFEKIAENVWKEATKV